MISRLGLLLAAGAAGVGVRDHARRHAGGASGARGAAGAAADRRAGARAGTWPVPSRSPICRRRSRPRRRREATAVEPRATTSNRETRSRSQAARPPPPVAEPPPSAPPQTAAPLLRTPATADRGGVGAADSRHVMQSAERLEQRQLPAAQRPARRRPTTRPRTSCERAEAAIKTSNFELAKELAGEGREARQRAAGPVEPPPGSSARPPLSK